MINKRQMGKCGNETPALHATWTPFVGGVRGIASEHELRSGWVPFRRVGFASETRILDQAG